MTFPACRAMMSRGSLPIWKLGRWSSLSLTGAPRAERAVIELTGLGGKTGVRWLTGLALRRAAGVNPS